ncbi:interleukin-12 receptor subunit beta-2 isoform X2 [Nannospalax galili]|uniref:interleukin-12 receptor subunit beta-2 isoform X2 n=1 Tax=Nannospalax galili TaxID=1026970 RepID=UPI0004ED2A9A|nr:interleukin-12 receptor subunit beta-2 isoform X2 [Nannospalax galili]
MAHAIRECSLALTFLTLWLLVKANIDVCKRGQVTAKPSHVVPLGSPVIISCSLKPRQGCLYYSTLNKLILYKSGQEVSVHHGQSFSFQATDLPLGKTVFVCKLACIRSDESQVCGVEISVGVVPEQPRSLSCIQKGEHGNVTCTWDPGRNTCLSTNYTFQLTGPKNTTWKNHCHNCDHLDLGTSLKPELPESRFLAKVTGTNGLGSASSSPFPYTFLDIVRPLPPWDIRINFLNASVSRCTLRWEDEERVMLNRLRYRPRNSEFWNMVNVTNAKGRHDLQDLRPFTEYEFQISSKLHLYKGSWSDWSESVKIQTPEEEPTGTLDVWYMKQNIDSERQRLSLFWKNLSTSEARGNILYYQVTLQEMTGRRTALQNSTERTSWTWVIPRTGTWAATVSAANSKGSSLPTRITIVHLCGTGLLAPHQISANSENMDNIVVAWQPPEKAASAVWEYVVEWRALHPGSFPQPPLSWLRIPPYNLSAQISEIPYRSSQSSHPINSLQPGVTYVLWMTALTAAGESPQGNEREFCLQGKANWKAFVASSICIAIITVGIFSVRYFRQKVFALFSTLRPQWCGREIPDPANSTWAKKYSIVEKMLLPMDSLLMAWPAPEEPEPLIINEVFYQMIPVFRHPHCPRWPEREQGVHHSSSKEDTVYTSSSSQPSRTLTVETRQLVDLYKVLGNRVPDSKLDNPISPLTAIPVDYLPSHEGYLPSNIDDLPPQENSPTDSLEPQHQHISLSVFVSSSLHPLTSCGERLTLDQLKMGCVTPS